MAGVTSVSVASLPGTGSTPSLSEPAGSWSSPRDAESRRRGPDVPAGLGLLFPWENWVFWGGVCPSNSTTRSCSLWLFPRFGSQPPQFVSVRFGFEKSGSNEEKQHKRVFCWFQLGVKPQDWIRAGTCSPELCRKPGAPSGDRGVLIPMTPEPAGMGDTSSGWLRRAPGAAPSRSGGDVRPLGTR